MSLINKRTVIVVASSTIIGFLGDAFIYSVGASKGGKMRLVVPRGKELFSVLAIGIIGGIIIDQALKMVEYSLETQEERLLNNLVDEEKNKIETGQIVNEIPTGVLWQPGNV